MDWSACNWDIVSRVVRWDEESGAITCSRCVIVSSGEGWRSGGWEGGAEVSRISRAGGLSFLFDGLLSWAWESRGGWGEGADIGARDERKAENGRATTKKRGKRKEKKVRKEKETKSLIPWMSRWGW
jgi:hypothetical protein